MITARQVAADVLDLARARKHYASELVDDQLSKTKLLPQDRRFVTQLVMGVVRRKATLDAILTPFVTRPPHAVEPRLWDILQLGAFQLVFLTHVPKHAAVHESVELASYIGNAKAKGFLNGVLRRVSELVTDEFVDYGWMNTVPFEQGKAGPSYRKLNRDVLPNPEENFPEYLSAAFSWPRWLAEHWLEIRDEAACVRLGFWFNAPPPLWLRINKRKCDRESYRLSLAAATIDAEPGEHPQSLKLLDNASVRDLPGYDVGDFTVQDISAMAVATAMNVSPGMRVLDLCSAPGGKTTHLSELMQNRGTIVACDIDPKRLEMVTALCARLGATNVETQLIAENCEPPQGPFHAALVDVPCSNTGVLGRRPEVRWRLRPEELPHLIRLQTKLLFQAIERVKPGGTIVYSTCSIEPDENSGVVNAVRRGIRDLTLEAEHHSIPGQPGDGSYWARLRKPG